MKYTKINYTNMKQTKMKQGLAMTADYLAISATSVPSEQVLSGRV